MDRATSHIILSTKALCVIAIVFLFPVLYFNIFCLQLALRPSRDYNGCSVLRRYFAQLHLLRARFPPETIGQLPIDFAWWERTTRSTDDMANIRHLNSYHVSYNPLPFPSGKMCTQMLSISRRDCRSSKPQSCTTSVSAAQMNWSLYYLSINWCRLPSLDPSLPWSEGYRTGQWTNAGLCLFQCWCVEMWPAVVNSLGDERSYHSLSVCSWCLCLSRCKISVPINASDTRLTMCYVLSTQERFATSHASKDLGPEFVAFYKNLMLVCYVLLIMW